MKLSIHMNLQFDILDNQKITFPSPEPRSYTTSSSFSPVSLPILSMSEYLVGTHGAKINMGMNEIMSSKNNIETILG